MQVDTISRAVIAVIKEAQTISWQEYEALNPNAFEKVKLLPWLDDEALCRLCESTKAQCPQQRHFPPITHEDLVLHVLFPELIARLKKVSGSGSEP